MDDIIMGKVIKQLNGVKTSEGVFDYKIANESYEDDYGSYRANYVAYKRAGNKKWERITPEWFALSSSEAEDYLPHMKKQCKECGHVTYELAKGEKL